MKQFLLFIGNLFFILIFIGLSVLITLNPFIMTGVSLEGYQNDYCQSSEAVTDPNNPLSLVCDNKYKKEKFIWLFIDGLAFDQLVKITNNKRDYNLTNFFRVQSKGYKQSGSLHEILITGKFSRNYPAQTTRIDHIFKQAFVSNKTLHFVGSEFPLFYLLGRKESKEISHYVIIHGESVAMESLCPDAMINIFNGYATRIPDITDATGYLFPNVTLNGLYDTLMSDYGKTQKEIKDNFSNCLKEKHFEKNQFDSLIFYTARIDHYNHSFDKKNIKTIFNIFAVEMGLVGVLEWIDNNPEYAFIVSSDHGGQKFNGQDDICNHGCNDEGNEAVLMVYTKELGMNFESLDVGIPKIWHDNVAPTVAQILKNANIPLEAQGLACEIGKDNILRYAAVKSKEIQLIQFIKKYTAKFPNKESKMKKYLDRLTQSDYANKITDMNLLSQMNDEFYLNYQRFLSDTQNELTNAINKDNNTFVYTLLYYSLLILLLVKVFFELKHIRNIVSEQKLQMINYVLLGVILFVLIYEVTLSFIVSKENVENILIFGRSTECFFLFLAALLYFKVFGFNPKHLALSFLFIIFEIICILMVHFEVFAGLRYHIYISSTSYLLNNWVNYPVALAYLFFEIHSIRGLYLDSKFRVRIVYFLYPAYTILLGVMLYFDKDIPERFVFHTEYRMKLVRYIYGAIGGLFLLSFCPLWEKIQNDMTSELIQPKRLKMHALAIFPMFMYVFFISDETERLLLFLGYFPFNYLFIRQIKKENNHYWKLISLCFLLMLPDILYIITQNTFSFDISLKVTTKCVGSYADATPILTGILMGTHKLKFFMLTAVYLLKVSPISRKHFMQTDSILIRVTLDIQMGLMICLYCYFLFSGLEENYLQIFIWIMTKCMISLIFDLEYFLWYCVNQCRKKKTPVCQIVQTQENEKIIEMETTETDETSTV